MRCNPNDMSDKLYSETIDLAKRFVEWAETTKEKITIQQMSTCSLAIALLKADNEIKSRGL